MICAGYLMLFLVNIHLFKFKSGVTSVGHWPLSKLDFDWCIIYQILLLQFEHWKVHNELIKIGRGQG